MISSVLTVQLISCTIGCIGFAIWFNVKGIQVFFTGLGAFFTWIVYAQLHDAGYSNFIATLTGAVFVALYAQIMARVNRAPATIFLTICVFPLVPGASLYHMMNDIVMRNTEKAMSDASTLVTTCLGIALGFIVVEIINKYLMIIIKAIKNKHDHPGLT